jgi:methylmalonyl-CoA/ethylmalonyl-CoA epimerase
MRLDHVALATRAAGGPLATLVGDLGALVLTGGHAIGYRPMQVYLGNELDGMKVELLEPWDIDSNDFLDRFLTRHGEGPHHLTFKVDDLEATLADITARGLSPVGIDLSTPIWKEAFLQPRDAHGTVVQLAESSQPTTTPFEEYEWVRDGGAKMLGERWWPDTPPRAPETTILRRIVMAAPSLPAALEFFAGVLEGAVHADGESADGLAWVELVWPGGGHLRLEQRTDRAAGVDRLEADGPGPRRELVLAGTRFAINPAG